MIALKRLLLALATVALAVPAAAQSDGYDGEKFVKAVREGNAAEALKLLAAKPIVINYRDSGGKTALIAAIENRDIEWVGYLLKEGADPNFSAGSGDTPLIAASRLGMQQAAEWLLSQGAKVDATNRMGETALIVAVQRRQVPIVRLLVSKGADPDKTDSAAGYSARDYAKRDSRTPEILRLIEAQKKPAR